MDLIRTRMLPVYRETIFEIKGNDAWLPVPPAAILRAVITAWNPDGVTVDPEDNLVRDIHLKDRLVADKVKHFRARGRLSLHVEEGWLIHPPHRGYVLDLLYDYKQWAALILDGRRRSFLWHDGAETIA